MADRMNIKFTIQAVDRFSKTMNKMERQLDRLKMKSDDIDLSNTIDVNVDEGNSTSVLDGILARLALLDKHTKKAKKIRVDANEAIKTVQSIREDMDNLDRFDPFEVDVDGRSASREIMVINQELATLDNHESIVIDVDNRPALRNLLDFSRQVERSIVPRGGYEIEANFSPALREAERTRRYMGEIFESQQLRLDADIDLDTTEATAEASLWARMMDALLRLDARMHVDFSSLAAATGIVAAWRRVMEHPVTISIRTEFNNARRMMNSLATFSRNIGEVVMHQLTSAFAAFSTAIVPILGVTAANLAHIGVMAGVAGGAAFGLLTSFAAAGIAAGGFAAVAIPALKGVFERAEEIGDISEKIEMAKLAGDTEKAAEHMAEMNRILDGMSRAQRGAHDSLVAFKEEYASLVTAMEPGVLTAFASGLDAVTTILEMARPMIAGSVEAVNKLMDALNQNLETEDVRAFFEYLNTQASTSLETITKSLGNFMQGLFNLFVAFAPLSVDMENGFLSMSESFRAWTASLSESTKFQAFVDYVRTNWPKVKEIFGDGIAGMVLMLAGFGDSASSFMDNLVDMMNRFREWSSTLKDNQGFQDFVDYVIANGPQVTSFFGALISTLISLGEAVAPIGAVVLKVATEIFEWFTMLNENYPIIAQIGAMMLTLGGAISFLLFPVRLLWGAFKILWPVIKLGFALFGKLFGFLTTLIARVMGATRVFTILRTAFALLTGPIGIAIALIILIATTIYQHWGTIGPWIQQMWTKISAFLTEWWAGVKQRFAEDIAVVSNAVTTGFSAIATFFTTIFSTIWKGLTHFWNGLVEMVVYIVPLIGSAIMTGFGNIATFFVTWWGNVRTRFSESMENIRSGVSTFIENVGQLWDTMRERVTTAAETLRERATTAFNNMVTAIQTAVSNAWTAVTTAFSNIVTTIQTAVTNAYNHVQTMFNSIVEAITTAANNAWTAVTTAFNNMVEAITTAMSNAYSAVTSAWDNVMSFLNGIDLFSIGTNIIQGMVDGITSMAGSLLSAATSVVEGAVGAVEGLLGIRSPSRLFRKIGAYTMEGMSIGIDREASAVIKSVTSVADAMTNAFSPELDASVSAVRAGASAYGSNSYANASRGFAQAQSASARERDARQTIEVPVFIDGREVARATTGETTRLQKRNEAVTDLFRGGGKR